jgi:hypothetical protein
MDKKRRRMMSNREDPSKRYFWASLKPLGQPLFWLPLGVLSLCLLAFWQYQQNPNWLKSIGEQPKISIEDEDRVPLSSPDSTPNVVTSPIPSPSLVNQNNAENQEETDDMGTSDPISTLTSNPLNNRNKNKRPSLFLPLLPKVNQNANPNTVKPLQPIQIAPPANDTNYPLQGAIDNLSRPNTTDPNLRTGTPNQPPIDPNTARYQSPSTPSTYSPYSNSPNPGLNSPYQPPVYNSQPANPTVMSNPNPSPVPTEPPRTQGYTIQRPIDARSNGY